MNQVMPAWQAIPLLEGEWLSDPAATEEKFRQFIAYHDAMKQSLTALLYRSALVQLKYGYSSQALNGLGFSEERLKKEAGA